MKIIIPLTLLLICTLPLSAQESDPSPSHCRLVVKVQNIKKVKGRMKFAIYNDHEKFLKTAHNWGDSSIDTHSVMFEFDSLASGIYAVSIFQDENENGKLDSNFIGIPTEPYAFSNDAKGMFGPPSFEDCQFEIKDGVNEITINL